MPESHQHVVKQVDGWPFVFGGEPHSGWLPPDAAMPLPTAEEHEILDVVIEQCDGGYLLVWAARPSDTCSEMGPPKTGDNWHETVEAAEATAQEFFGIERGDWTIPGH
jgi:hypothetical protein